MADTAWGSGPLADFGVDSNDHALLFDSSSDVASTVSHVAATNKSFTVMAFVKLGNTTASSTAVSQDGAHSSGFGLGHVVGDSSCATTSGTCWTVGMVTDDSATSGTPVRALSAAEVAAGQWVHLSGVYDATAGQLRLYTCELGTPAEPGEAEPVLAAVSHTSTWNAAGPLRVGRGLYQGTVGDFWPGVVDDVRVFDEVVPVGTIAQICQDPA